MDSLIVLKKELKNTFKDRRLIFSLFGIPAIILLIIFNVLGMAMSSQEKKLEETVYKVYTDNPQIVESVLRLSDVNYQILTQTDGIEQDLRSKKFDIAIVIDKSIARFQDFFYTNAGLTLYTFSNSLTSERIASKFSSQLSYLRDQEVKEILKTAQLNPGILEKPNVTLINIATEKEKAGRDFGGLLPYMLVIYLFSASFAVGFDTTAGEKERQTLTILLANRVSRSSIAWGKIFFLMIMNILTATVSVVAFSFGFSAMIPKEIGNFLLIFSPATAVGLLFITFSLAILIAAIITVIGIFSKTVKEAAAYSTPIYLVTIIFGILGLQPELIQNQGILTYVPLINGIFTMKEMFTQPEIKILPILITILVNVLFAVLLTFLAAKMFSDEKYVFRTEN